MSTGLKHGAGFVVSGGLAFVTDAGILSVLTRGAGQSLFANQVRDLRREKA